MANSAETTLLYTALNNTTKLNLRRVLVMWAVSVVRKLPREEEEEEEEEEKKEEEEARFGRNHSALHHTKAH